MSFLIKVLKRIALNVPTLIAVSYFVYMRFHHISGSNWLLVVAFFLWFDGE